jgi:CRISPR/Cas system-associated exonuclease Cas4 (RecB family)
MLGTGVPEGLIFHAKSRQRTSVVMDEPLRDETRRAVRALHAMLAAGIVPSPVLTPRCDGCSLRGVCLPETCTRRQPDLFICR